MAARASYSSIVPLPTGHNHHTEAAHPVHTLSVTGGVEHPEAEISGLAWFGDQLIFLPQNPDDLPMSAEESPLGEAEPGRVFVLDRTDIEDFIDHPNGEPLRARSVPLRFSNLEDVERYDGFEAIAFDGYRAYGLVELRRPPGTPAGAELDIAYLVEGRVLGELEAIRFDFGSRVPLPAQTDLANIGYESLILRSRDAIALYEANGSINEEPTAAYIDRLEHRVVPRPIGHLEYRATDATELDENNRFFVMNYHWPGAVWASGECELTGQLGDGPSHSCHTVERIIELEVLSDSTIQRTDREPIELQLLGGEVARNWEGIVRLGNRGFLIMTDEHPGAIFGFVPLDSN